MRRWWSRRIAAPLGAALAMWMTSGAMAQIEGAGVEEIAPRPVRGMSVIDARLASSDVLIDTIPFESLDIGSLLTAEFERRSQGLAPHFAVARDVALTPANSGSVFELPDGTLVWRLRFECENTRSISVGTQYDVPPSAKIYVTDGSGQTTYRALTAEDNKDHGWLFMPLVEGSTMELYAEVDADEWEAFENGLMITQVNLAFLGLGEQLREARDGERGFSDSCNIDVACPEGDPWGPQIDAVAMYVVSGVSGCSGAMINNTNNDGTPLFYTANHCAATDFPGSMTIYWNYQNSFCRTGSQSGQNGNGSLSQVLFGATLLATYSTADTTLVELDSTPPESWGVVWAGWNRSTAAASEAFGVHHPNLAEKRISIEPDGTQVVNNGAFHQVQYNPGMGGIEGGSSGSPLYDQNGRIIGTACCVNTLTPCYPQFTFYGRLARAWSSINLDDYLDPANTGALTMDYGMQPFGPPPPPPDPPGEFDLTYPADGATGIDANGAITFTWTESSDAISYVIRVSENPDMSSPEVGPITRSTENLLVFPGTLDQNKTYYWTVEAQNDSPDTTAGTPAVATFSTGSPAVTGACCFGCFDLGNGPELVPCADNVLESECEAAEGKFAGQGSTCSASACDAHCAGDLLGDGDGDVTLSDFSTLAANFGAATGATRENGDVNCDAAVSLADFSSLASAFGCTGDTGHPND